MLSPCQVDFWAPFFYPPIIELCCRPLVESARDLGSIVFTIENIHKGQLVLAALLNC